MTGFHPGGWGRPGHWSRTRGPLRCVLPWPRPSSFPPLAAAWRADRLVHVQSDVTGPRMWLLLTCLLDLGGRLGPACLSLDRTALWWRGLGEPFFLGRVSLVDRRVARHQHLGNRVQQERNCPQAMPSGDRTHLPVAQGGSSWAPGNGWMVTGRATDTCWPPVGL